MDFYDYEPRLRRPPRMKTPELQRDKHLKHMIFASQFDRDLLEHLASVADLIRVLARDKAGSDFLSTQLSEKRAMLYFTQPSTRTFLSFTAACQILGITVNEVRDPSLSSEAKGESPFDSIRMFSSYFDLIIMRSRIPNFAECCAYLMNDLEDFNQRDVPIINGGAGTDEHPTQALLDIYTIQRTFQFTSPQEMDGHFFAPSARYESSSASRARFDELRERPEYSGLTRGLNNKEYCFCGDIGRGRTVKSLANLLSLYDDVTLHFVSPQHPKLGLPGELQNRLLNAGARVLTHDSLESLVDGVPVIERADCLYMTRIQQEYNEPGDADSFRNINFDNYKLTPDLVARMKDYAPILHPFPRDANFGEIPPTIDTNPRAMYFRQARNGMWIRAALLAYLFNVDRDIASYYRRNFAEYTSYAAANSTT
ncbi:MAG: aspartate carbamoyltransferase [Planctomycetota bacterium]|nr:aspartate carbamoyltransferase [Planctomycetota bacterium]